MSSRLDSMSLLRVADAVVVPTQFAYVTIGSMRPEREVWRAWMLRHGVLLRERPLGGFVVRDLERGRVGWEAMRVGPRGELLTTEEGLMPMSVHWSQLEAPPSPFPDLDDERLFPELGHFWEG